MSIPEPRIDAAPVDSTDPASVGPMHVKTAGIFERAVAAIADLLIPLAIGLGAYAAWPKSEVMLDSEWNAIDRFVDGYNADVWLFWGPMVSIGLGAIVWKAMFGLRGVNTLGRRLCKLSLISKHGSPPNSKQICVHCAVWLLGTCALMLGHLWMLADPEKRTLHDRVANLYLVRTKSIRTAVSQRSAPSHELPESATTSEEDISP